MHILVVEDEPKLAALLADYLRANHWQASLLSDGLAVLPWLRQNAVDLVILDVMLPGRDGLDICRELRTFSSVPVIMLTARVDELDRVLGLEIGADDYVCKPFSPREVVARIKALARRVNTAAQAGEAGARQGEGGLEIDKATLTARHAGRQVQLTPVEFALLDMLVGRAGGIVSRAQLMQNGYEDYRVVSDRTIDSHIKKVRRKLAQIAPGKEFIHAVYGAGYRFKPGVTG